MARNPSSGAAHAGLATSYVFRANYLPERHRWAAAAVAEATEAARLDGDNAQTARVLGMAHAQAGRLREAAAHYRRSLDLEPGDHNTRTNLGRVLAPAGRIAEALLLYEQHMLAHPEVPDGYAHVASALASIGYDEESAVVAHAALALQPVARDPHLVLVRLELLAGNYDDARGRLERLLEVHPDCTQCVVLLGLVAQQSGDLAAAAMRYRTARTITPSFVAATLRLAQLQILAGRRVEANALLNDAEQRARAEIAGGSEVSTPRWNLAVAAALRGDRPAAAAHYDDAVRVGRRDALWDVWDPLLSALHRTSAFASVQQLLQVEREAAAARIDERVRYVSRPSQ